MTLHFRHIDSPLGPLTVSTSEAGLNALEFPHDSWFLPRDGWREAIGLIRDDASVEEVLLSGGDPLSLSNAKLAELLADKAIISRTDTGFTAAFVKPERLRGAGRAEQHGGGEDGDHVQHSTVLP